MTIILTRDLRNLLIITVFMSVLCGLVYPLTMTGFARSAFPHQSGGSLIERDGELIGSSLIGQTFSDPQYFHSRPSAAGDGYDASASSGSNLGPTSAELIERIRADIDRLRSENGLDAGQLVPVDAATASASGLDPHVSPAYAQLQAPRVAKARGLELREVLVLVEEYSDGGGFLIGEPRVNVLELNLALDRR